jgi:phosphoribosylformimino-5-aminoimidazole carboxamide ribotide isomerase
MIAVPAVDLRGGRCVQLVGGRPDEERVSLPDPWEVAAGWRGLGFSSLHVVDLDAALGSGDNGAVVDRMVRGASVDLQVGGGIRDDARADALLARDVDRIVVGTRAVDDPAWLSALAARWPARVVVALDVRDGVILRKGWTEATGLDVETYLPTLASLPLAGILSTDVGREGRLEGIDRDGCTRVVDASPHPVCISGGITTLDELAFLEGAGAAGVVLGMALYTDTLDGREVARRWGGAPDGPSWTELAERR